MLLVFVLGFLLVSVILDGQSGVGLPHVRGTLKGGTTLGGLTVANIGSLILLVSQKTGW